MAADQASAILIATSLIYLFLLANKIRSDNKTMDIIKQIIYLFGLFISLGAINLGLQYISGTVATQTAAIATISRAYLFLSIALFFGFFVFLLYLGAIKLVEQIKKLKFRRQRK